MLHIYPVILETIRTIRPLIETIARHDADLARQLRRAAKAFSFRSTRRKGCTAAAG
jgi:hypothetical protein